MSEDLIPTTHKNLPQLGSGRPPGALNKTSRTAKMMIESAADAIGGINRFVEWIKEDPQNESDFWTKIYPKLLPLQVNANLNQAIIKRVEVEIIDVQN